MSDSTDELIQELKAELRAWHQAFRSAEQFHATVTTAASRKTPNGEARAQGAAAYRGHMLRAFKMTTGPRSN